MSIETINPPELFEPAGYAHVVVATGTTRVNVVGEHLVEIDVIAEV
jgi:hypothetical protein